MSDPCEDGAKKWDGDTYLICLNGQWIPYAEAGAKNKPLKVRADDLADEYDDG